MRRSLEVAALISAVGLLSACGGGGGGGGAQPGSAPPSAAQPTGDGPTEADVKALIQKNHDDVRFTWRSVTIRGPRQASNGEIAAAGLPPNATIWPTQVDYTQVIGDGGRDFKWNYYVFRDDSGAWSIQSNATPGNSESDLYHVDPTN